MGVTKSPLFLLRRKTRLAYSLCREALDKHDNDLDKAEAWLQTESMRLGWQKASKLQSRSAKQGLIGLAVHSNRRVAAMIELNCETDFVAKNTIFQAFSHELTKTMVIKLEEQYETKSAQKDSLIQKYFLTSEELKLFDEHIVPIVSKLGENVQLGRAALLTSLRANVGLYSDVHGSIIAPRVDDEHRKSSYSIQTGRFGSLIGLQFLNGQASRLTDDTSIDIGRRLCKHIIGYDPSYIEMPPAIKKELIEAKKAKEFAEAEKAASQQQEQTLEDSNEVEVPYIEEPPSMLDQTLIMDGDNQKVGTFCESHQIRIVDINRFECGQAVE